MQINRNNYEIFFLDYRENNLTPQQVAELMVFLEENPDLKIEFEDFEDITLVADESVFFNEKSQLKKKQVIPYGSIDDENFEATLIANNEGDLSSEQEKEFAGFIGLNPDLKLQVNALRQSILKPNPDIVYQDKEGLKKYPFWVTYQTTLYYAASIAAIFILMIGSYFFLYNPNTELMVEEHSIKIEKQDYLSIVFLEEAPIEINPRKDIDYPAQVNILELEDNRETIAMVQPINSKAAESLIANSHTSIDLLSFRFDSFINNNDLLEEPEEVLASNGDRRKNFVSSFLSGLTSKLVGNNNSKSGKNRSSFIEYSVQGYNLLADKEVEVKRKYDENGDVMAYNVIGERVEFTAKKRRPSQE
jgi:hypothetical protein